MCVYDHPLTIVRSSRPRVHTPILSITRAAPRRANSWNTYVPRCIVCTFDPCPQLPRYRHRVIVLELVAPTRRRRSRWTLSSPLPFRTMAPVKGETDRQRAQRLQKKANELRDKASFRRVVGYLKVDSSWCLKVERDLIAAGKLPENYGGGQHVDGPTCPSPHSRLMIGDRDRGVDSSARRSDDEGVNDRVVGSGDHAEVGPGEKNRSRVELLAPRLIELALTAAEKVALSKGNLCALRKKGQRVVSKSILLEYLEAMTGLSPDSYLDPAHRGDRGFVDLVCRMNVERGRRCQHLEVPCDWSQCGPYSLCVLNDTLLEVSNTLTKDQVDVDVEPPASVYFIDLAFSEARAVLRQKNSDFRLGLCQIFCDAFGGRCSEGNDESTRKPQPKRRRMFAKTTGTPVRATTPRKKGTRSGMPSSPLPLMPGVPDSLASREAGEDGAVGANEPCQSVEDGDRDARGENTRDTNGEHEAVDTSIKTETSEDAFRPTPPPGV